MLGTEPGTSRKYYISVSKNYLVRGIIKNRIKKVLYLLKGEKETDIIPNY